MRDDKTANTEHTHIPLPSLASSITRPDSDRCDIVGVSTSICVPPPLRRSVPVIRRFCPVIGWRTMMHLLACRAAESNAFSIRNALWELEPPGRSEQQCKEHYSLPQSVVELTFVFLCITFRGSPFLRSSHVLTKDADSVVSARPLHYSKSDCRVTLVPPLSPCSSLTHAHRSIGYHNRNPQSLAESVTRLMYLRVYDNRDRSNQSAPSPSLCYSLTHTHRSIGHRNRNPQLLAESVTRLMYLREYGNRDRSNQSTPSPSLCYSLTHTHRSIGYRNHNPQLLVESTVRLMYLRVYGSRPRLLLNPS